MTADYARRTRGLESAPNSPTVLNRRGPLDLRWPASALASLLVVTCLANGEARSSPPLVTLEVRLDRPILRTDPEAEHHGPRRVTPRTAYLRVRGLASGRRDNEGAASVNVGLVVDRLSASGTSVGEALLESVREIFDGLVPGDVASLVGYSDIVEVLHGAGPIEEGGGFGERLAALREGRPLRGQDGAAPRGGGNVFGGLAKGAAEVRKFVGNARISHLVLMSAHAPGLGPRRPAELAQLGLSLARDGIGLTVIDLSEGPSPAYQALAAGASGVYIRLDDPRKLRSTVGRVLQNLREVRARNLQLRVRFATGIAPVRVFGPRGEVMKRHISAQIGDMRVPGAFEFVAEVDAALCTAGTRAVAETELRYYDLHRKVEITERSELMATCLPGDMDEAQLDFDVAISVALAIGDDAREGAKRALDAGDSAEAAAILGRALAQLEVTAAALKHSEILSLVDELEQELAALRVALEPD